MIVPWPTRRRGHRRTIKRVGDAAAPYNAIAIDKYK
ncbi:protein of unknown function [Micropruina glycogenica]|uniref:Uncharacterized protein n=1 Tax=Micropruina glycogenica TaxID=75385 RepID=A0A2N9JFF9_9ACTN|nr:protein of unknown function [Micropruina glycogenica]